MINMHTEPQDLVEVDGNIPHRALDKWGDAARAGFQIVPDILFKNQEELGLTSTDLVVLLNILTYWWYAEKKPFPRTTTIAKRMGASPRTVQRSIEHLQALGLLRRVSGGERTYFDPEPLVDRLEALAQSDRDFLIKERRHFQSG